MTALVAAALIVCVFVVLYRGPGWPFVRGYVGDVAAAMLVYGVAGLVWRTRMTWRAVLAVVVVVAVELYQAVGTALNGVAGFLVGSFPDPWDLVAYAVGIAVALIWERRTVTGAA